MRRSLESTLKYRPLVFNLYKPPGVSSYDLVRHMKRNLPRGYGKIGHFGTLDPFAEGVLMIGVSGATRINDFVHKFLPKTYVARGKLGICTETGDLTVEPSETDDSDYLFSTIAKFDPEFIDEQIKGKFLGKYMQPPHRYSAAKFEGKALHQWAREGVDIKKTPVEREIYRLEVVSYEFPYLTIRATVSSGTYIRTLFSDIANYLGTLGVLENLCREAVGGVHADNALHECDWPQRDEDWDIFEHGHELNKILPLSEITLDESTSRRYSDGISFEFSPSLVSREGELSIDNHYWVVGPEGRLLGLGKLSEGRVNPAFNLPRE